LAPPPLHTSLHELDQCACRLARQAAKEEQIMNRAVLIATVAAFALAGCRASTAPENRAEGGTTETATATGWTPFVNDFISGWFKLDPAFAVYEGKHEFDGQLPDWSNAGLKRQADFLNAAIQRAQSFPDAQLSAQQRFERD
jgi:hypothetical protein